ncbi:5-methyltetrahydrofolate--homocysteine methyltransferase [Halanaerobium congolense]|uniref:Methionine synthase n=1 Tax=Halanaerobium congolense TaxID=54121 RepID=A0A1I0BUJ6_9FIRM|nr:homocysteine S-methyltransferase family protein [Halanaerobium congolense]PTX17675.1 5-methyltetrahydrofolate--homocysteine methyltransferase [Halanaerobium congolense]SDF82253.1 5-methyltetrahydrofolate--homocysteine methyltransferase [Halanaerobium congolense]SET10587.1 5-methyltetrahydrofolate--homocysteine methyltransferase [Halanaerobium congolense]SFP52946.1 5-methyltetrahydrofolate--homocysteine methyltransferase [Halanaerobium congolense]
MELKARLGKEVILFDGAMGTVLQQRGLKAGDVPEKLNIEKSKEIIDIHKSYLKAGAEILTTNTFGANALKMEEIDYSVEEVISAAVENARKAVVESGIEAAVALDMGPLGELLEPMGSLTFDEAYNLYQQQVLVGVEAGADLIHIETIADLYEARAAVLAAKENSNLPVFCTLTFEEDGRTFTGGSIRSMISVLEGLGVDGIGLNCSLGPEKLEPLVEEVLQYSKLPVILQANAGLPVMENGETVFKISPAEYFKPLARLYEKGLAVIGGCCGTNEEFISLIAENLKNKKVKEREVIKESLVCSPSQSVDLAGVNVVGERINPTGKAAFKDALRNGDLDYILKVAVEEVDAGANILDVNIGLPDIDEKEIMVRLIKELQGILDVPLQIDSSDPEVIEAALRYYNGTAIVNSVNGEAEVLEKTLPAVKKYGAAVIGLTMDDNGIPDTAAGRFAVAERIVNKAAEFGISRDKIIIDCLTLTASAQQEGVKETLKALNMVKEKLGVKTTLGVSNVSFGLPARPVLNRTFLSIALYQGLNLPIIDPNDNEMMAAVKAAAVLNNIDQGAADYIEYMAETENKSGSANSAKEIKNESEEKDLQSVIIKGLKSEAARLTEAVLKEKKAIEVVNEYLIPALDIVGERYEKGEIFLPQLVQSAETVKEAFAVLKAEMARTGGGDISKGKIIMATVKGDVHDIGKNIVKTVLENYGYQIIDLGKNVNIKEIVSTVKENKIKLLGLSALMTTTVKNMEKTIKKVREICPETKIMVGGAVLTADYADMIEADFYARDAKEAAEIAKQIFE